MAKVAKKPAKQATKKAGRPAKAPAKKTTSAAERNIKKAQAKALAAANAPDDVTETGQSATQNETNFKIVMGVVRPPRVRLSGASPYPFKSLPVGGSFMIPAEVIDKANYSTEKEAAKAQAEACGLVANRLSGATRRFTKRNDGYKFTVFTVDNGTTLGFDNDIGVVVQRIK